LFLEEHCSFALYGSKMEITKLLGYVLAVVVGISLGLVGSGGSILTVPILVYVMRVQPVLATAYSLFVVGMTSLVGGIQSAQQKKVDFKTVLIFGIPSIVSVYLTRAYLLPLVPDTIFSIADFEVTKPMALMVLFALVMVFASVSMIRPCIDCQKDETNPIKYHYPLIWIEGLLVGVLTGFVGAGGGFLIIPALVLLTKMPMRLAVGTSLFIIAAKSLLGFIGDVQGEQQMDWAMLSTFTGLSIIGIFIGIFLSRKIDNDKLKTVFGWFVLLMGIYILIKEIWA